jgi:hypothetical protein
MVLLVFVAVLGCVLLIRMYPYPSNFTTFPRLTQTASRVAGDPINLVVIGNQEQITQAFHRAGWLTPDPITPQTTARIVAASLTHQSYPAAPVSTLYAFGRVQDLAFEKPTNDVQNRGHIRLWKTGMLVGGEPAWVGQASYDSGIELSASTHRPTHHIAPTVDWERTAVATDLAKTGLVTSDVTAAYTTPIFFARNGGGDFYESDGDVSVINFTTTAIPLHQQTLVVSGLKSGLFSAYDSLVAGSGVVAALLVLGVASILGFMLTRARNRKSLSPRTQAE